MKTSYQVVLLVCLLIVALVPSSIIGMHYSPGKIKDYDAIKPEFVPPNTVFAVVWPILYILQAVALWYVLRSTTKKSVVIGLSVAFGVQLVLNFLWSPMFFKGKTNNYKHALWVLMALVLAVVLMWVVFLKENTVAALMWTPYVLWLFFATLMNSRIVTKSFSVE